MTTETVERELTVEELAEQVCLMVGWTASDQSERGKARTELWQAWAATYRAAGGSLEPRKHPELSDQRIRELAARRDATVAVTRARIADVVVEAPAVDPGGQG